MRLFLAVNLSEGPIGELTRLQDRLAASRWSGSLRLVRREQLHLTIKFLGEVPEESVASLSETLQKTCARFQSHTTRLEGLGAFPSLERARILWAGVADPHSRLRLLAEALESEVETFGIPREGRTFSGHITIARIARPLPEPFREFYSKLLSPSHDLHVDRLALVHSELERSGPVYRDLAAFPLSG